MNATEPEEESNEEERNDEESSRIRKLPENVINRIAAGEVVVRPSAALKELLENSLDAGATSITVTARDGGLKLLQVTDDGKGITHEDLPLLCERFATSKLRKFEDLETVSTFGFRGEALASISHVARLSVLTKTRNSNVAYKASYLDGSLRAPPSPTAGIDGTTIIIEDMFYNLRTRRMALRSTSEEYRNIVEVVSRYAVRYPDAAFICRRQGGKMSKTASAADVRTEANSSVLDNIRVVFGSSICNETFSFEVDVPNAKAKVAACVTSANYSMKKAIFILFINGRLVDCNPFKRAILSTYTDYLPKGSYPFTYFDLEMNQSDIDVNVHPTKKEVRFLYEDVIIEAVAEKLSEKLKVTETSRTFLTQSVLTVKDSKMQTLTPQTSQPDSEGIEVNVAVPVSRSQKSVDQDEEDDNSAEEEESSQDNSSKRPQSRQTRRRIDQDGDEEMYVAEVEDEVDDFSSDEGKTPSHDSEPKARAPVEMSLSKKRSVYAKDKVRAGSHAPIGLYDVYLADKKESADAVWIRSRRKRSKKAIPLLTSVEQMLAEAKRRYHHGISEALREHIFVGVASENFVLLQHQTKLLLAQTGPILTELMYQQILMRFADHELLRLEPPAPVMRLLEHYSETQNKSEMRISSESCATILLEKAPMLSEYFGITFKGNAAAEATIESIPLVFPSVMPKMTMFGQFLYRLAIDTDWSDEAPCLKGIARLLAEWYGQHWEPIPLQDKANDETGKELDNAQQPKNVTPQEERKEWILRHILFASCRKDFYPPTDFFTKKVIREITSTSKLYKIFERC